MVNEVIYTKSGLIISSIMNDTHVDTEAIRKRFFEAIDLLVARGVLRGRKSFATHYNLNLGNFWRMARGGPKDTDLPLAYLTYLVRDLGISSFWLLTGIGEPISKRPTIEVPKRRYNRTPLLISTAADDIDKSQSH